MEASSMEGSILLEKLEMVLKSFLCEDVSYLNNYTMDKLIFQLSQKDNAHLLGNPIVLNWMEDCVDWLCRDFRSVHWSVVYFMLKLCAIMTEKSLHEKVLYKIAALAENNYYNFTPLMKLGYVRLIAAISNYKMGLQWIKSSKCWHCLITYCLRGHTLYIVREASCLIHKILHSFAVYLCEEEQCLEILGEILKPIDQNVYEDASLIVNVDDTETQKVLCSTLDLVSIIFQESLKSEEKTIIPHLCETHHKLEMNMWKLAEMTHNEFLLGKVLKAQTSYNFAYLHICNLLGLDWYLVEFGKVLIAALAENNYYNFTPLMKLGYVRLIAAISNYKMGLQWIKSSKCWHCLITYCLRGHTLYIVREASCLIHKILHSFAVYLCEEEQCLEILGEILKPIDQNVYEDASLIVNVDDTETQKVLCSTLDLVSIIFQESLKSEEKTIIPHLCETHHKLEMNMWKLAEMTHNEFLLGKVLKAQTSYNFATLIYEKWKDNKIDPMDFNHFGVNFFNTMKFCIDRRSCVNFLKLAKHNHFLWKTLGNKTPSDIFIENESIQFENQLTMFHLMPVLYIVKTRHEEEIIFDHYLMKLFSISSEFTVRICYSFRDILLDCPDLAAHLTYKSIHGILSMKSILNKNQAVVVFQALVYALKEFSFETASAVLIAEEECSKEDLVLSIPRVLYATLVCLHTLVEEYNITWKESIESMCLMDIVLNILKNPSLSSLIVVQAIKLTQLSVEHFLSPNMALLVDNIGGSTLQNLGPVIKKHFHHQEWEVRDSTLELVTSVVSISRLKFPAFQQYILDNNICSSVFSIVKNDEEFYVRASGLKCLTQMVAINLLWEKSIMYLNLVENLLQMIPNEDEGTVRKEAITCLTQMYAYRRINSSNCCLIHNTLKRSAVSDIFWEVKVAAIHFWEVEIYLQFTNQGMIDGTFPSVTFSKENKKIITLTESEIFIRIRKALKELFDIGCLDVILKCLKDDCDLEVVKAASRVVKQLFEKLDRYDYRKAFIDDGCIDTQVESDAVRVIEKTFYCQSNAHISNDQKNKTVFVSVKDFFQQLNDIDFEKLIADRNESFCCLENLSSLLDEIIISKQLGKSAFMDCY